MIIIPSNVSVKKDYYQNVQFFSAGGIAVPAGSVPWGAGFTQDGSRLYVANNDAYATLRWFDVTYDEEAAAFSPAATFTSAGSLAGSSYGLRLAVGKDHVLRSNYYAQLDIVSIETNTILRTVYSNQINYAPPSISFDDTFGVTLTDSSPMIFTVSDGGSFQTLNSMQAALFSTVENSLAVKDGNKIYRYDFNGTLFTSSGGANGAYTLVNAYENLQNFRQMAFSPDGSELAVCGANFTSIIDWNTMSVKIEHYQTVASFGIPCYSPDGTRLYLGQHQGGRVRALEFNESRTSLSHVFGFDASVSGSIQDIAVSPNGSVLTVPTSNGMSQIW